MMVHTHNFSFWMHYIYSDICNIFDYDNIIKHIDTAPSVRWDLEKNFIVTDINI